MSGGGEGFKHIPVLLDETIESLFTKPDGIYVDGTTGGGGHSGEIAKRLKGNGRLICIDRDREALEAAQKKLEAFKDRITFVKNNFFEIKNILKELDINGVDGILLDLGVSSYQLDTKDRGFSYMVDAPLDMRMDAEAPLSAADVVNGYTEAQLYRIIRDYGEDRFAKNIAKHICAERQKAPIETTLRLSEAVSSAIPMKVQKTGRHPAMRTFQAIRIEVNGELEGLKETLDDCIESLNEGGRLAVITFHSLEDRIVKNDFRENENPCTCPPGFPVCVCGKVSRGRVITKKPVQPGERELRENSRAHSSKLRVFEKGKA